MKDENSGSLNAPLLARVLDERAHPVAARVGAAAGASHGSAFNAYEFGLQRSLDDLAALTEKAGVDQLPGGVRDVPFGAIPGSFIIADPDLPGVE